ncbi:MAG: ribonuclease P protein component, partial [bacterium]|nr:ribonuclease P protein component [bacterium]
MARLGSLRFSGREVRELYARGRPLMTDFGRAWWGRPPSPQGAGILFVVSKKVSKRSTERNRIRRQLTEAFRKRWRERPFAIR